VIGQEAFSLLLFLDQSQIRTVLRFTQMMPNCQNHTLFFKSSTDIIPHIVM